MNKKLACHYSVLRFCPYPETDEFVNVGIVLACPATGYLDFSRARKRLARVGDFFPELDAGLFKAVMDTVDTCLNRVRNVDVGGQLLADFDVKQHREAFLTLVRPREAILFYSEPRVVLSNDPAATLADLFQAYVERRFAKTTEYKEIMMCQRLERTLREHSLLQTFKRHEKVGDERYHVTFPLVRPAAEPGEPAARAIKALHLDKTEPTELIRHADSWLTSVKRLRDFKTVPSHLLFVLHPPQQMDSPSGDAYRRVLGDYQSAGIQVVTDVAADAVLAFAK